MDAKWVSCHLARPGLLELRCWLQALVGLHGKVVHGQRHDVVCQVGGDDVLLRDRGDVGGAGQAHDHLQLVLQHVDHADDAVLAVGRQGVEHGTAGATGLSTQRASLEDVAASAHAAVDEDGESLLGGACLLQCLHHLRQHLDACTAGVQLTAAMVGQHAASQASVVRLHCVFGALHALEQHLHLGDALQPRHVLPVEARVNVAADGSGGSLGSIHAAIVLLVTLHVRALLSELVAHVLTGNLVRQPQQAQQGLNPPQNNISSLRIGNRA